MHLSIRDIDRMADMDIKYIRKDNSTHVHTVDGVDYISFDKLDRAGVVNAFSTRIGGVSEGYLGSMNLSFHRGDDADLVMENHRRFATAVGYDHEKLVFSDQVHKTDIYSGDRWTYDGCSGNTTYDILCGLCPCIVL